jgi:hypothetical protein
MGDELELKTKIKKAVKKLEKKMQIHNHVISKTKRKGGEVGNG